MNFSAKDSGFSSETATIFLCKKVSKIKFYFKTTLNSWLETDEYHVLWFHFYLLNWHNSLSSSLYFFEVKTKEKHKFLEYFEYFLRKEVSLS